MNWNRISIVGAPGTGKTTIIKAIVDITKKIHKYKNQDIALLAPTGRSAKRMSESVGVNAYTIHKYLKWNKETGKFQVDEFNKTRERIVIVDEASMIDIFLFSSLLINPDKPSSCLNVLNSLAFPFNIL